MSNDPAKQIPGLELFPKMVYPGTGEGEMSNAGTGVIVKDEDEEKWVMDGNKLEDFGKPPKEQKKSKAAEADASNPVNPANPANPEANKTDWTK